MGLRRSVKYDPQAADNVDAANAQAMNQDFTSVEKTVTPENPITPEMQAETDKAKAGMAKDYSAMYWQQHDRRVAEMTPKQFEKYQAHKTALLKAKGFFDKLDSTGDTFPAQTRTVGAPADAADLGDANRGL